MLDFSQNGLNMLFSVTEDGGVVLESLSRNYVKYPKEKKSKYCNIVELHRTGENPDDHHFAKHTVGSGTASLKYVSHTYTPNAHGNKLEFLLADNKTEVTVHYQFYTGIAAVRAWTVVKNISDAPIGIEYLSSFTYTGIDEGESPIEEKLRVLIPHNAWYREVNWKEYKPSELGYGKYSKISGKRIAASNTGTWSTKEYLPMGAVKNTETKNTLLWQIENSGSWHWEISDVSDMLYLKLSGPTEQENHWYKELASGESFESVPVSVAVAEDFDGALAEMTKYRRKIVNLSPADRSLPVIFNDYMNCLMGNPTEEKLHPIIDLAAAVGAEYYCIDAGWYSDGRWWDLVGEWQPSEKRFPHGMKAICDRIRERGMIPGLWLEIEVMGIACPLAKELPDECFFMRHGRRVIDHGRYQLDFRHPTVRAHATAVVDRLVNEYGVGYIKNDYNIEAGIGTEVNADSFGDGLLLHNRAFLEWVREIRAKHPELVWENCASGGMRMDYAMLSCTDLQSSSDQTNYRYNAYVASAIATAALPEQSAVWAYPKSKNDLTATEMNMVNALPLRIHLSGEIFAWSEEQKASVREAIACYKRIRKDIPRSIPFYPLGIPQYATPWLCSAYRFDDTVRVALWRMEAAEDHIEIPLDGKIERATILYPSGENAETTVSGDRLTVTMREQNSAVLIEVTLAK